MNTLFDATTQKYLQEYCRRKGVRSLALFGSHLHGEAKDGSDIDLLIEFQAHAHIGLFRITQMEMDLTDILGRKVDLRTAQELSRYFRRQVQEEAQVIYAEK